MQSIEARIATELAVGPRQVAAAVSLLDAGSTVPFIARYRKEATGGLDDTQLRTLEERLGYLRELEERRAAILKSIGEQGKLTPPLQASIAAADTKQRLEDLYLPYKPKRRTKAMIAREAGLDALAVALLADATLTPEQEAQLSQIASKSGTDAERLVKEAALHLLQEDARFRVAVREGVAQSDRGELIDEAEMDARLEQMLRS